MLYCSPDRTASDPHGVEMLDRSRTHRRRGNPCSPGQPRAFIFSVITSSMSGVTTEPWARTFTRIFRSLKSDTHTRELACKFFWSFRPPTVLRHRRGGWRFSARSTSKSVSRPDYLVALYA